MGFFFSVLTSSLLALFLYVCDWTFAIALFRVYGKANEMETRKQLETEMETQPCNCCSPNKISVLLTFISRHSRALPSSSL